MDREYYKALDQIETALQEAGIEEDAVFQAITFDSEKFTEETAKLWAREHYFNIVSNEGTAIVVLDESEFVTDTLKEFEIEDGITARVGLLKMDLVEGANDCFLSLRNDHSMNIKLSEDTPHIIELATVVNGYHASYGEVNITKEMLRSFVKNFREGVVGVDLMIDYDHNQSEAAGWIKSVFLSSDETKLYGEVRWTPQGAKTLSDRAFRYFSPEFTNNYVHPHTGVQHGPTLLGGGLVNRPFLKMDAIIAFKEANKGANMETISLAEHKNKVEVLEKKIETLTLSENEAKKIIDSQKEEVKKLSEKIETMEKEKKDAEIKARNEKLFSEGKISKAQLDALNEGKDIYEVLSLSEKMHTTTDGKTSEGNTIQLSEQELEVCKKFNLTPEQYVKYNS